MTYDEQIKVAAYALDVTQDQVLNFCAQIPDTNYLYACTPERGGLAVIVDEDGTFLTCGSYCDFDHHFQYFKEGKRDY